MARIGVFATPVPGHLNPMIALGCELKSRGHDVIFFHESDVGAPVLAAGLQFHALAKEQYPAGHLRASTQRLGRLSGLGALRFTIGAVRATTEMICRHAPAAVRAARIDALLVDQMEPAGAAVAEHLRLPFVTVANALIMNREPDIPPPFTPWKYRPSPLTRLRNRLGYCVSDRLVRSITATLNDYRVAWGLNAVMEGDDSFSKLAQISQLPPAFDYPRKRPPAQFHYVGPLRRANPIGADFPWERLDGRPLYFASLGSLQGGKFEIFRTIAEACRGGDCQLVIAHGGGLTGEQAAQLPGGPLVVPFAPQVELLRRATLTITHAGLNTVLDSLTHAVPLIAIPITFEQPAIANRIRWCGAGASIALARLSVTRLREQIQTVLSDPSYQQNAARIQASIRESGGVKRAAGIVESVFSLNRSSACHSVRADECPTALSYK